jgi:hypothetical protein
VEKGDISPATLGNCIKAVRLFSEMNDVTITWKEITRGLPRARRFADDRAPALDEKQRIIEYADRRIKPIVYTMSSSGMRLETWDYLRWGHIKPIGRDGKVVAAKITVYAGDPEEYYSFVTPEAYYALAGWMKFREDSGEGHYSHKEIMDVRGLPQRSFYRYLGQAYKHDSKMLQQQNQYKLALEISILKKRLTGWASMILLEMQRKCCCIYKEIRCLPSSSEPD